MTRLCRSRSISRASQDRHRLTELAQYSGRTGVRLPIDSQGAPKSARTAKLFTLTRHCLRRRFSASAKLTPDAAFPSR